MMSSLAMSVTSLYPGWRMRIYTNVTPHDVVFPMMCQLYCDHDHVDICDTRNLPSEGNLNSNYPVGRMWRFQALGDPTVRKFLSRDMDSWILPREREAVKEWEHQQRLEDTTIEFLRTFYHSCV